MQIFGICARQVVQLGRIVAGRFCGVQISIYSAYTYITSICWHFQEKRNYCCLMAFVNIEFSSPSYTFSRTLVCLSLVISFLFFTYYHVTHSIFSIYYHYYLFWISLQFFLIHNALWWLSDLSINNSLLNRKKEKKILN
jgi:hypothetical protein